MKGEGLIAGEGDMEGVMYAGVIIGRPIIEEAASPTDDCPPAVELLIVVVDDAEVAVVLPAAAASFSFSLSAAALAIRSSSSWKRVLSS